MKTNRHLGAEHFEWVIYGILGMFLANELIDLFVAWLIGQAPQPITVGNLDLDPATIDSIYRYNWAYYIGYFLWLLAVSALLKYLLYFRKNTTEEKTLFKVFDFLSDGVLSICALSILYFSIYQNTLYIGNLIESTTGNKNLAQVMGAVSLLVCFLLLIKLGLLESEVKDRIESIHRLSVLIPKHPVLKRLSSLGKGGSASWANMIEFEKKEVHIRNSSYGKQCSHIILGRSLFQDDLEPRLVGIKDDAHVLTVGMTGSGKSTTVLYPNLVTYDGPIVVFDPKGDLPRKTFSRRTTLVRGQGKTKHQMAGHYAFLLDPFNHAEGNFARLDFNPLSLIKDDLSNAIEIIEDIVNGCVIHSAGDTSEHFNTLSEIIIRGMLTLLVVDYPPEQRTLPRVMDLLSEKEIIEDEFTESSEYKLKPSEELLIRLKCCVALGDAPREAALVLEKAGSNEHGSIFTTLTKHLAWTTEPAMRKHLSGKSEYAFWNMFDRTIYIVLTDEKIKKHSRWVRVLMNILINQEKKNRGTGSKEKPTLFILDEYSQLGGNILAIKDGFSILRDYGIKLWLIFQNVKQMEACFAEQWTSTVSASTIQVIAVKDQNTAKWVSDMLGDKRLLGLAESDRSREHTVPLLTPNEVGQELGKDKGFQIVFAADGSVMRLNRLNYKPLDKGISFDNLYPDMSLEGHFYDY